MAHLPDAELDKLQHEAFAGRKLTRIVADVSLLVLAAARCGYTDDNQRDALFMALGHLTGLDEFFLELLLTIKPSPMK